jgi:RNA polymerase primary sigma factor
MTPNYAEESASSPEPGHLAIEVGKRSRMSASHLPRNGSLASRLRKAWNRAGGRLSARAAFPLHPPLLSALEERDLAERIKAGDQRAQQELVLANRKLVFRIVRDYKSSGLSEDDLIQEGSVGLIRAAQNFDPRTHAIRFSSYAVSWIRAFIIRAVTNDSSLVRLPEYTRGLRERSIRAARELVKQSDTQTQAGSQEFPSRAAIAHYLGISQRQVERAWKILGERAIRVAHDAPSTDIQTAEHDALQREAHTIVHAALRRLSPFEAWVIRERFGLGEWSSDPTESSHSARKAASEVLNNRSRRGRRSALARVAPPGRSCYGRSFDDLSRDCGLSVHRIRLIEKSALDKLRSILSPALAYHSSP